MLRQIIIEKKISANRDSLNELLSRLGELDTRSTELEAAVDEATNEEEIAVVEEEAEALETERAEITEKKSKLEGEIAALESELEELNSKEPGKEPEGRDKTIENNEREVVTMSRHRFFGGLTRDRAEALVEREDVKNFLKRTRGLMEEKRAVTGGELLIPEIMLELLRDNLHTYSKLISRVNLRSVAGKARQNIAGAVPEAIWTEACGKLNELAIVFNQVEVDGYKVGGFIAVCNATLEDSDIALANEILTMLGQSLGLGVDKAILYGTGTKMPVGIVTRLAEAAEPAYWGTNERDWTDLSTSHLMVIDNTVTDSVGFYKDLIKKLGKVKANYSTGQKFWAMNSTTFANLQAEALGFNAAGAVVSGQTKTMPVVGGDIVELDFIPDNHIIGGYGSLYLLAERAGATLAQSEHVQFIEDNTVFKGTARYDGRPIFGEAFVAINIDMAELAAAPAPDDVTFAADAANA